MLLATFEKKVTGVLNDWFKVATKVCTTIVFVMLKVYNGK
jgi:DMSO reductase anchor subunit